MFKRIWLIFKRDLKVNLREAMPLYIIIAPILLAVGINLLSPGINDTTVNVALIEGENIAQAEYFNNFAHVEAFENDDDVKTRVMGRDNIVGILREGDGYYILTQGNEPESVVEYTKLLKVFYEGDVQIDTANVQLKEFGETVPPLKKMLVNMLLLMIPMLAGMLTALNIVEEKSDKTLSAINVSPTSRTTYILGKSLMGIFITLATSVACIYITGFFEVNIGLLVLIALVSAMLSLMVGFAQGLNSDDVMEAAGSVKLMFLPMAGSVVGYELVNEGWQFFFYWSPFYWAYRANNSILTKTGTLGELLLYVGIIIAICAFVYTLMLPWIKKRLQ